MKGKEGARVRVIIIGALTGVRISVLAVLVSVESA